MALMDVLGQEGDPEMPSGLLELQFSAGRYFTLIYSEGGALQWEHGHTALSEAEKAYEHLLPTVVEGRIDPAPTGVPGRPGRLRTFRRDRRVRQPVTYHPEKNSIRGGESGCRSFLLP